MDSGSQTFFGFLIFIALGVYVFSRLPKRKKKKRSKKSSLWKSFLNSMETPKVDRLPYRVKESLLSSNERRFLFALGEYIGTRAYICPMVGLKDIVTVETESGSEYQKYLNKIWRKHIDFILVTPNDYMSIICGIELDDSTHNRESVKKRDRFKDKVFMDIGVPLIRVKTSRKYDKSLFDNMLGAILSIEGNYKNQHTINDDHLREMQNVN